MTSWTRWHVWQKSQLHFSSSFTKNYTYGCTLGSTNLKEKDYFCCTHFDRKTMWSLHIKIFSHFKAKLSIAWCPLYPVFTEKLFWFTFHLSLGRRGWLTLNAFCDIYELNAWHLIKLFDKNNLSIWNPEKVLQHYDFYIQHALTQLQYKHQWAINIYWHPITYNLQCKQILGHLLLLCPPLDHY